MEERSKLQKAVLISMAAMVVLFGVLMVAARFQKGVEFEGGLLRRTETEESVIYNGKVRGEQVEITVRAAGSGNRPAAHSGGAAGACGAHPHYQKRYPSL